MQGKDISEPEHIWHKQLSYGETGDFVRVQSAFNPTIQAAFEKEWDGYIDYLSMPEA